MSLKHVPLVLVVMDGLALNPLPRANAVFHARKPTLTKLFESVPHTTLSSFGERVGLPAGQMGNSEVGHLNIGGGRIVQQELTRISLAIARGELAELPSLSRYLAPLSADNGRALHVIGLVSGGGVHSSMEHAEALVAAAAAKGVRRVYVHAITDGRDRPPDAAAREVGEFQRRLERIAARHPGCELALVSLVGRYYAMDRDKRWERVQAAYDLFTGGDGSAFEDPEAALREAASSGETDEFLKPRWRTGLRLSRDAAIQDGDSLVFFNFRADRMREIVSCFLDLQERPGAPFTAFERTRRPRISGICTLTEYEADFGVQVLFEPMKVPNHLGAVISAAGLRQLRIAETEKYAHVTYFFNGGVEEPLPGEDRILVPSPRDVPTYDHKPEMSANEVTDRLVDDIRARRHDVTIVNYANCDMVGHTGNFDAAVKAVEIVDTCVGRVLDALSEQSGCAVITADHGNADQLADYDTGTPHTFHTTYPVPLFITGAGQLKLREGGALCDIAPTVLDLLGIDCPPEMTGRTLIVPPKS